jgi:hypothetical protein
LGVALLNPDTHVTAIAVMMLPHYFVDQDLLQIAKRYCVVRQE